MVGWSRDGLIASLRGGIDGKLQQLGAR